MSRRLVRSFYKLILKSALEHDRNPALKGILVMQKQHFYDRFRKVWLELDHSPNSTNATEKNLVLHYTKALMQGGVYYLPGVQAADLVRKAFRGRVEPPGAAAEGEGGGGDGGAAGGGAGGIGKDGLLDGATAFIRLFERNIAKGREMGIHWSDGEPPFQRAAAERLYDVVRAESPQTGGVLLAHPLLWQGSLTRSAILIVKRDPQATRGLVVNRRMPFTMGDLVDSPDAQGSRGMSGAARESLEVFRDNVIFRGGDVGQAFLSVLHPHGELEGSQKVAEGVYWQCDLAAAKELVESGRASPHSFKLLLGYCGWDRGQLEGEMRDNTWVAVGEGGGGGGGKSIRDLTYSFGNEGDTIEDEEFDAAGDTWMDEEAWTDMADGKAYAVWSKVWCSLGWEYAELARVPVRREEHL